MRRSPSITVCIALVVLLALLWPAHAHAQEAADPSMAFWGISAIGAMFSVVGGIILALYHRNAGATDARIRELAEQINKLSGVVSVTREDYVRRAELDTLRADWGGRLDAIERRMVERDHELKADLKEVENEVKGMQAQLAAISAANERILNLLEARR